MRIHALILLLAGIGHGLLGNQTPAAIFVAAGIIVLAMRQVETRS